ncbi:MAG: cell division protein ZapA [Clostridiales Family XIII bacterium]|jgi:cell division protein ZapA|nr:cell division protein ZapA [Clostridiales Family XIII bacterium]
MSDTNKVNVRIYGQEYTISGVKARDYIMKVADHVDAMMREIAESTGGGSMSSLAVLAAVNITDEMFSLQEEQGERDLEKDQLAKDVAHYTQLWEEAKRNFLQYKDDAQTVVDQKDKLQERLNQLAIENDTLIRAATDKEQRIEDVENRVKSLVQRLKVEEEGQVVSSEQIRDLEDKYKEIEGSYFELQMENIRLKGDLERYKKLSE